MLGQGRFGRRVILAVILTLTPTTVAQSARWDDSNEPAAEERRSEPIFVFRISPQLLADGLDLLVEKRLARDYNLDDYQREELRQLLHEHVPRFLRKHRDVLQDLWAEWLEAQASPVPPSPDQAARWAERLLPIVGEFQGMVDELATGMREFLDDDQEVLLDGYLAAGKLVTRSLTSRLKLFAEGGFEPELHWPGYRHVRHAGIAEARRLRQKVERSRQAAMERSRALRAGGEAEPAEPARLAAEVVVPGAGPTSRPARDEWARYVEWFIRRYQLNDEQQQKARQLLKQQSERRDQYLRTRVSEMERITAMFEKARSEKERALAEASYARLNRPVERMFEELKRKLDTLPTRAQRRAAALRGAQDRPPAQRSGSRDRSTAPD